MIVAFPGHTCLLSALVFVFTCTSETIPISHWFKLVTSDTHEHTSKVSPLFKVRGIVTAIFKRLKKTRYFPGNSADSFSGTVCYTKVHCERACDNMRKT